MLKIGDFSRLSRVSVRMLRYYDDNDLIKPISVDEYTGYRYYSEQQLLTMGRINALKEMGMGVAAIKEILKCSDEPAEIERLFCVQKALLTEEAEKIHRQLGLLDTALKKLGKEEMMKYDCVIKEIPEKYVASVRQILPKYEDEGRLWHILFKETKDLGMTVIGPAMAVLHDAEYKEADVDVEVQLEVKESFADTEHVRLKKYQRSRWSARCSMVLTTSFQMHMPGWQHGSLKTVMSSAARCATSIMSVRMRHKTRMSW